MPATSNSLPPLSANDVDRFKREAKAIHRETGVAHSHALDQVALREGYPNWSRLMLNGHGLASPRPPEYLFVRDAAGMKDAMRSRGSSGAPKPEDIEDLVARFVSPANAVRYAIAYLELALAAPRYSVNSRSIAYLEMRHHLPYRLHTAGVDGQWLLVNRHYKPVGSNQPGGWAAYDADTRRHFEITEAQAAQVSHPGYARSQGLYGDGSTPWSSRANAAAYMERLKLLLAVLTRKPAR